MKKTKQLSKRTEQKQDFYWNDNFKGLNIYLFIFAIMFASLSLYAVKPLAQYKYTYFEKNIKSGTYVLKAKETPKGQSIYGRISFEHKHQPGLYRLKLSYRTKGNWEAQFATYIECSNLSNATPWQIVSASTGWSEISMLVKLKNAAIPTLVFNQIKTMGKIKTLEVTSPELTIVSLPSEGNWFSYDGYMRGSAGGFPFGWAHYHEMLQSSNGLTKDFGFQKSNQVMKMSGSSSKTIALQSFSFRFPNHGELEFSIWARSIDQPARITMLMLGDKYKWQVKKSFQLSGNWKKYTISRTIPEKILKSPFFWCRISIEQGQSALLGKMELKQLKERKKEIVWNQYPDNLVMSKNRVNNPGFEIGSFWWEQWQHYPKGSAKEISEYFNRRTPKIVNRGISGGSAIQCESKTSFNSFCFPIETGEKYTVSAYLKNAVSDKKSTCKIFLLNNNWKQINRTFKVTGEWQRYSFSSVWPYDSRRKNAYLSIGTQDNAILIDNVQVEVGALTDFSTPLVQIGLITPANQKYNVFNSTDTKATMTVKAVCRLGMTGKLKIKVYIADAWGKEIMRHQFETLATPVIRLPLAINNEGRRGVFHVTLKVFDARGKIIGYGQSRYAVCRDLSSMALPSNPMAGHYDLMKNVTERVNNLMPLLKKYLPLNSFNRSFCWLSSKQMNNPQIIAECERLFKHWTWSDSIMRIMCMSRLPQDNQWVKNILHDKVIKPNDMKKLLNFIKLRVKGFKGIITGWELLNEPFLWRVRSGVNKGKPTMGPEKTAQIYNAAYPVIKSIDPSIKVIGPCISLSDLNWLKRFLNAGGKDSIDIFSFHGYCNNPDLFNMYERIIQCKKILAKYGLKNINVWNSEQYYGARIPYQRQTEKEYFRDYFKDNEIDTAIALVSNLINHAAAGSRLAMFAFFTTTLCGFEKEYFLYDFFAAGNATVEFLGSAGLGKPIKMGSALRCFLFPNARGGGLATIHAINTNAMGKMRIPSDIQAFDMMGNLISKREITLGHSIIYLRFPVGMSKDDVVRRLHQLQILGLGKPFAINISMLNEDTLAISLNNRLNQGLSGNLTIKEYPSDWKLLNNKLDFSKLAPGDTTILKFRIKNAKFRQLSTYRFRLGIKTPNAYFSESVSLTALFAKYQPKSFGNGNIKNWENVDWITLGKENTSKNFNPKYIWAGPKDLTVKIACGWNQNGLALGIIVSDNSFHFPKSPRQSFNEDSVQIYFDMKNDATKESGHNKNIADDVVYQIGFINGKNAIAYLEKASTGRYIGESNEPKGIDTDVKVTCRKLSKNELFYDIYFPKSTLPMIKFDTGTSFGFSLLVNDNDGKGRKTGLTLAPKGKEPYRSPQEYLDMILLP